MFFFNLAFCEVAPLLIFYIHLYIIFSKTFLTGQILKIYIDHIKLHNNFNNTNVHQLNFLALPPDFLVLFVEPKGSSSKSSS